MWKNDSFSFLGFCEGHRWWLQSNRANGCRAAWLATGDLCFKGWLNCGNIQYKQRFITTYQKKKKQRFITQLSKGRLDCYSTRYPNSCRFVSVGFPLLVGLYIAQHNCTYFAVCLNVKSKDNLRSIRQLYYFLIILCQLLISLCIQLIFKQVIFLPLLLLFLLFWHFFPCDLLLLSSR